MKKIYTCTLLLASFLFLACEQNIYISRDHDINAEVSELQTTLELKVLYCNLTDATALSMIEVEAYINNQLTTEGVDIVTFLADDSAFEAWLSGYAAKNNLNYIVNARPALSETVSACLSKEAIKTSFGDSFNYELLTAPVLHFEVEGIHFVVTELQEGGLAMADGSHDPATLQNDLRKAQIESVISSTVDASAYYSAEKWVWSIDMNSPTSSDIKQYGKEELLPENCVANDVMEYNGLIDCISACNNYYQPSSIDSSRHNFLYSTVKGWQMMQPIFVDTASASTLGVTHYPIMVTLKSEE